MKSLVALQDVSAMKGHTAARLTATKLWIGVVELVTVQEVGPPELARTYGANVLSRMGGGRHFGIGLEIMESRK